MGQKRKRGGRFPCLPRSAVPEGSESETRAQDEHLRGATVLHTGLVRVKVAATLGNGVAAVLGNEVEARREAVVATDAVTEAAHHGRAGRVRGRRQHVVDIAVATPASAFKSAHHIVRTNGERT